MLRNCFIYILLLFTVQLSYSDVTHVLKKGETLYSLSRKYNVSVDDIMEMNRIDDPSKVRDGLELVIKKENNTYTVRKGDTLYSIARKNKVNVNELLKINEFNKKTIIKVGQKIYLPVKIDSNSSQKNELTRISVDNKAEETKNRVAVVTKKDKNDFFWPVDGKIEKLNGKLQGSMISADKGAPVYSVSSGRVVWEGPYRGFGRVVFIESSGGYVYVYGGNEQTRVSVGDKVEPGSEIGLIGFNIHESKPGIYFSVYKNGEPVDVEKAPRL